MRSEVLLAQLDEASGGKPSTSLLVSVRTPLETLVDDNRAYFNVKMEAQMRQIDNAIQKSTRTIIRAIGDGPWKRVQDPNIRQVWKDMNAHSSVKARYFVLALHDHYLDQYENMNTFAGMHLDRDIAPPSPTLSHAETEAPNADGDTAFLQDSPAEADKWCLQYLSIQNISPLAEAIDDDVSGFIKIAEVNNFSNDKPEGFSMLRWVTFWAAGSAVEASMYHLRIEQLMEKLLDIVVMPENRSPYADYKFWLMWIRWLLRSRSHTTTEHPELIDLIRRHMTLQEKSITDSLEPAKWEIDGTDTVSTLLGPGRIEKYLYPTLYLVLRYHYQVFSLGSRHVLDNRELEAAYRTLWSILDACSNRTTTLAAAFDQRRGVHDFKRFAGGLFNNWNTKNPFKQFSEHFESNASFTLPDGQYAMEDRVEDLPELSAEKLHYCILDTANQLDISEDQRAYIDLRRKQIVLGFSGKSLDDVETSKMAELERIHETDRLVCQEIAWREFTGGGYHSFFCNGCGMAPILGTHYQCIGCFIDVGKTDFDLCQNCVTCLPEKTSTDCSYHPSTHPMNRFPYASDSFLRGRLREKAVEIVKELEKTSNTAFTCKGPCGRADAHGVHLRCIHCEDFILCADCISAHEADEFNGHGPLHFFTRFSGEPLIFKPKKEEVSDKVRMANMEAVLGEVKEQLAKQASLIQSLSDALNRAVGDNGIIIKE